MNLSGVEIWYGDGLAPLFLADAYREGIERIRLRLRLRYRVTLAPVFAAPDANLDAYRYEVMVGQRRQLRTSKGKPIRWHSGGEVVLRREAQVSEEWVDALLFELGRVLELEAQQISGYDGLGQGSESNLLAEA